MSRSDWPFPTSYAPLRTHTSHSVSRLGVRDVPIAGVFGGESARPATVYYYATFSMTSCTRGQKGVTTNHYGGTYTMWAFVLRCLFNDYCFLVQLLPASLMMAVSNRVESSSTLPPYQSPQRHDSKNTTFHIPAFDSIFCCLLQGSTK